MDDPVLSLKVVGSYDNLTSMQQMQFKQVIMEGLKGKFAKTLPDDTESIKLIIDIWIKYGFLPMERNFSVIEEQTENVLAILLLNDYHKPNLLDSVKCLFSVIKSIGLQKALKIAFDFLEIDNMNKADRPESIKAEIYLVATSESCRGKGIGTVLLQHVLKVLQEDNQRELSNGSECKVKLLVFGKNPAIRLYQKLGFKQVSSVATPKMVKAFGDAYDRLICMEKSLS